MIPERPQNCSRTAPEFLENCIQKLQKSDKMVSKYARLVPKWSVNCSWISSNNLRMAPEWLWMFPEWPQNYSNKSLKFPQNYLKMVPKYFQNCSKIVPKLPQNCTKSVPKLSQNDSKMSPKMLKIILENSFTLGTFKLFFPSHKLIHWYCQKLLILLSKMMTLRQQFVCL